MGGWEHWEHLQSYRHTVEKDNGVRLQVTAVLPDALALDFELADLRLCKAYDGEHGYLIRNGQYQPMREGELHEMREEPLYYAELIFADRDALRYEGMETVNDRPCHKITLTKREQDVQVYWLDAETHLILQTGEKSADAHFKDAYFITNLSDYRSVDGYMLPHLQSLRNGTDDPRVSTTLSWEVNLPDLRAQAFAYRPTSIRNLIAYWKDRYAEDRVRNITFEQITVRFDQTGAADTSIWQEAIEYPRNFRIDFGEKEAHNTTLFRADSVYVFREGQLRHADRRVQAFMLIEGAIYADPVDTTLHRLAEIGVDTSILTSVSYQGRATWILGAKEGDRTRPQLWVDAERRSVSRRMYHSRSGTRMEVRYDAFKQVGGHEIETWLEFYENDKLVQTERYEQVRVDVPLDSLIFSPHHWQHHYWY
ncbi:MAG: hypothetical protein KTR24_01815 [Saprospiraceae bacterium]|nr:hypothetical protein [Saprospiraceae bacterium]